MSDRERAIEAGNAGHQSAVVVLWNAHRSLITGAVISEISESEHAGLARPRGQRKADRRNLCLPYEPLSDCHH